MGGSAGRVKRARTSAYAGQITGRSMGTFAGTQHSSDMLDTSAKLLNAYNV